jgi:hypothetical protein
MQGRRKGLSCAEKSTREQNRGPRATTGCFDVHHNFIIVIIMNILRQKQGASAACVRVGRHSPTSLLPPHPICK